MPCYPARPLAGQESVLAAVKIPSSTPVTGIEFAAFDTETTGLDLDADRLLDVGAVRFRIGMWQRSYASLVRPGRSIPDYSTAIHHITEEMVSDAPPPRQVLAELCALLDGAVLLAHNAPFDMSVLTLELGRQGMPVPDVAVLDTCVLAEAVMADQPTLKLGALMRVLGCSETNDHRALPDARCLIRLFEHICAQVPGATWQHLLDRHGPPFSLREFAQLRVVDQWHFAVAVNAIEERAPVGIAFANGAAHREVELRPRGFELREGRWCVVPEKPHPEPVYMDSIASMVKRPRADAPGR